MSFGISINSELCIYSFGYEFGSSKPEECILSCGVLASSGAVLRQLRPHAPVARTSHSRRSESSISCASMSEASAYLAPFQLQSCLQLPTLTHVIYVRVLCKYLSNISSLFYGSGSWVSDPVTAIHKDLSCISK